MRKVALILSSILFICSCNEDKSEKYTGLYDIKNVDAKERVNLEKRKVKIQQMEKTKLSKDQIDRKIQSIAFCEANKIPVMEGLPSIESERETKIRTKNEIIERALALAYLGVKSEGTDKASLDKFIEKYKITNFTKKEKEYVLSDSPTEQQTTDANWRYESLHVLLWSLGYIDSLSYPDKVCNVADDIKIIALKTKDEFINQAKVRSKKEILDQADLIYRIDWACTNSRVKGEDMPAQLDGSIVYERHYSLNWLINHMNADWDNISTDT